MRGRGFTLLELLVVVAIIGVLCAILIPTIEKANERARVAVCGENLHQMAVGLAAYANDFGGIMAVGPGSASAVMPGRAWNSIGDAEVWIGGTMKVYTGAGVLVGGGWLTDPRVLVCPSDDDKTLRNSIKGMIGGTQDAYGGYLFRQLDQRSSAKLHMPGVDGAGLAANAVALDWQSRGPVPYGHASHDGGEFLNVMYADGHVQYFENDGLKMGAKEADFAAMPGSYVKRVDQVWVNADWAEGHGVKGAPVLP